MERDSRGRSLKEPSDFATTTDGLELLFNNGDVVQLRRTVQATEQIPAELLGEIDARVARHQSLIARSATHVPSRRPWTRQEEIELTFATATRPPDNPAQAMWDALSTPDSSAQDEALAEWEWEDNLELLLGDDDERPSPLRVTTQPPAITVAEGDRSALLPTVSGRTPSDTTMGTRSTSGARNGGSPSWSSNRPSAGVVAATVIETITAWEWSLLGLAQPMLAFRLVLATLRREAE